MYQSATYGQLEIEQVPMKILDYYEKMKHFGARFDVTIGSDSQTFDTLKLVNVIAVICEGHGGIFFYEITRHDRTNDVRQKLTTETNESLQVAMKLTEILEDPIYDQMRKDIHLAIHIDAGWSDEGKTKDLIPTLVGWLTACGFEALVKPDSFVASTIADRISK